MNPTFKIAGYEGSIEYATEAETLVFANRVRVAGGAEFLKALLPSVPGHAGACLIANALNFGCAVRPNGSRSSYNGEFDHWYMELPLSVDGESLSYKLNLPKLGSYLVLPRMIGNAAHAFDNASDGWTLKYRKFS